jgi:uncharacterized membrane protein YcaP (DUF421 family)
MIGLIAAKLIIGIFALIFVARVIGKKSLSQLTAFDFIYTLILGGLVEGPLYDDQVNILHILFTLVLWGVLIRLIEYLIRKSNKFNHLVKGSPGILIYDGKLNILELEKNNIEMEQLRSILRKNNCFSLKQAKYLVLECGGEVSLLKYDNISNPFTFLLIEEGNIKENSLKNIGKEVNWLISSLEKIGYTNLSHILYAEWSYDEGFFIIENKDTLSRNFKYDT